MINICSNVDSKYTSLLESHSNYDYIHFDIDEKEDNTIDKIKEIINENSLWEFINLSRTPHFFYKYRALLDVYRKN